MSADPAVRHCVGIGKMILGPLEEQPVSLVTASSPPPLPPAVLYMTQQGTQEMVIIVPFSECAHQVHPAAGQGCRCGREG